MSHWLRLDRFWFGLWRLHLRLVVVILLLSGVSVGDASHMGVIRSWLNVQLVTNLFFSSRVGRLTHVATRILTHGVVNAKAPDSFSCTLDDVFARREVFLVGNVKTILEPGNGWARHSSEVNFKHNIVDCLVVVL